MPAKFLTSPFDGKGGVKVFKFGGGANEIFATVDPADPDQGYTILTGGGDDAITGSAANDEITGGGGSDLLRGGLGDDMLYGGDQDGSDKGKGKGGLVDNIIYGDDRFVDADGGSYTGGNDTLVGGGGEGARNTMVGDVQSASNGTFQGGDDTLISGMNANDRMTGDFASGSGIKLGGADTFVFGLDNGQDLITDFTLDQDRIDLSAFGFTDVTDLDGLWTTQFGGAGTQLTLDLDGEVDGFGDTVTFARFSGDDWTLFDNGEFIFA